MMQRTIRPVGCGLFATEQFHLDWAAKKVNVVYDCGACRGLSHYLEKLIDEAFWQGEHVDYLFISHFHDDHIGGLGHMIEKKTDRQGYEGLSTTADDQKCFPLWSPDEPIVFQNYYGSAES